MSKYLDMANAIMDEIVDIRRHIHRHPELSRKEYETSKLVQEKLAEYGVDTIEVLAETAVVATIRGNKGDGKCIALRCDMDALPVQEETSLPWASVNPGVMHACGHDMHTAMMLGNAKMLCQLRDEFAGTVKLIFQHAEEYMPKDGSKELVGLRVMDGVDAILGMHNFPTENDKVGVVGFRAGGFTTSADEFGFDIIGTGGHGSLPHKAPDPILAAAEMIMLFQQVQSREVAPTDAAIFMMNKIEGGKAPNIISDHVYMIGNARAFTTEARQKIEDHVYRVARAVEDLSHCKIEVSATHGYDSVCNDDALSDFLFAELPDIIGRDHVEQFKQPMNFSEDFSFYSTLTGVPEVLMILQAGHVGNAVYSLHNSHCAVKEEAMPYGMAAMTGAAVKFLNK